MSRPPPFALRWPAPETDLRTVSEAKTFTGSLRLLFRGWGVRALVVQLIVVAVIRGMHAAPGLADLAVVVGVLVYWPLQEHVAHLLLLHFKPLKLGPITIDPLSSRVHRWHHEHPWVMEAVFVPWPVILMLVPVHAALWWFLMPTPALAFTGMVAFTTMTIAYEWVHLLAHLPYRPRFSHLQRIQVHHRHHHFKNERSWFAFMIPEIDRLFGTFPDYRTTPKSATVRTIIEPAAEPTSADSA